MQLPGQVYILELRRRQSYRRAFTDNVTIHAQLIWLACGLLELIGMLVVFIQAVQAKDGPRHRPEDRPEDRPGAFSSMLGFILDEGAPVLMGMGANYIFLKVSSLNHSRTHTARMQLGLQDPCLAVSATIAFTLMVCVYPVRLWIWPDYPHSVLGGAWNHGAVVAKSLFTAMHLGTYMFLGVLLLSAFLRHTDYRPVHDICRGKGDPRLCCSDRSADYERTKTSYEASDTGRDDGELVRLSTLSNCEAVAEAQTAHLPSSSSTSAQHSSATRHVAESHVNGQLNALETPEEEDHQQAQEPRIVAVWEINALEREFGIQRRWYTHTTGGTLQIISQGVSGIVCLSLAVSVLRLGAEPTLFIGWLIGYGSTYGLGVLAILFKDYVFRFRDRKWRATLVDWRGANAAWEFTTVLHYVPDGLGCMFITLPITVYGVSFDERKRILTLLLGIMVTHAAGLVTLFLISRYCREHHPVQPRR